MHFQYMQPAQSFLIKFIAIGEPCGEEWFRCHWHHLFHLPYLRFHSCLVFPMPSLCDPKEIIDYMLLGPMLVSSPKHKYIYKRNNGREWSMWYTCRTWAWTIDSPSIFFQIMFTGIEEYTTPCWYVQHIMFSRIWKSRSGKSELVSH